MDFSPSQIQALERVQSWMEAPFSSEKQKVYRIFGPAGVGKTEILKEIHNIAPQPFFQAAYTGKAASVMKLRTGRHASTVHSLIYIPKDKSASRLEDLQIELSALQKKGDVEKINEISSLIELEKENLRRPMFAINYQSPLYGAKGLALDEVSMIDQPMGKDLLGFGVPLLVLGDPYQLPPIRGGGFFTETEPDSMLTEIHRQAAGSPIIYLATRARNKEHIPNGEYGKCIVKSTYTLRDLMEASQIIVGRNRTRHAINTLVRDAKGFTNKLPMVGDRLVCLRNNHPKSILNGTLWDIIDVTDIAKQTVTLFIRSTDDPLETRDLRMHRCIFEDKQLPDYSIQRMAEEFDFAYALTLHKFQGSQTENPVIFDESKYFEEHAHRWKYTGMTRAIDWFTMVKG